MIILRLVLFSGLCFHKLLWEVLKRKGRTPQVATGPAKSPWRRLIKAIKVAVLLGLVVQTLFSDVLPITEHPMPLRIVGSAIYFLGLSMSVIGRWQLGRNWVDLEDYQVIPEQSLVTTGIYRYVRHPIYGGDLLLLLGLELALNSWLVLGVPAVAAVVVKQALAEEALLARSFKDFDTYRRRTKRFIPFVV